MSSVTLKNDFHNTSTVLRCETLSHMHGECTIRPTVSQIRRAKRSLCGIAGCTCSDDCGCRGAQEHNGKRLVVDVSSLYAASR